MITIEGLSSDARTELVFVVRDAASKAIETLTELDKVDDDEMDELARTGAINGYEAMQDAARATLEGCAALLRALCDGHPFRDWNHYASQLDLAAWELA
jgi:hypothetical protein